MNQKPLVYIDGKKSQLPSGDFVNLTGTDSPKIDFLVNALAAYDTIASITYLDSGTKDQRIDEIIYSSTLFPDRDVTKTAFYLGVGTINQRLDKVEYTGSIFSPDKLVKQYTYTLVGNRYLKTAFNWSIV